MVGWNKARFLRRFHQGVANMDKGGCGAKIAPSFTLRIEDKQYVSASHGAMSNYRRAYQQGGVYFFTVVAYERRPILTQPATIDRLREAFGQVMAKRPFVMDAICILPDHLHCIWRLPENDADFSTRWRLVKHHVASGMDAGKNTRSEKQVWQRRFWEHLLRDDDDWYRHMDYIHYNPVKHGYVEKPGDWLYGSFPRAVAAGFYQADWGASEPARLRGLDLD
jgi:putative transposase